jgi:leucyl aminopeptidase (aminopeptidase T)
MCRAPRIGKPQARRIIYKARRNLAELGIGTNPSARRPDNILEAEKIEGTVHIAIGDNIHMGGQAESDLHTDFVQPQPDLYLDGQAVILSEEWQIHHWVQTRGTTDV